MYLDFLVIVPSVQGKITTKEKGEAVYVNYEVGREYYPDRKYTIPKRVTIGKLSKADRKMMVPNQNFLTYFPETELPGEKFNSNRSSCLRIGAYIVIQKVFEEHKLQELLERQFDDKDLGNETYLGGIADISQLEYMLGKAKGYGYKNIGFILDRGYFSKGNIRKMDEYGCGFVIMEKGMAKLVNHLLLENKGRFEEEKKYSIRKHHVYGITVKEKLYLDDEKDRYFHIYHSTGKEHGEREGWKKRWSVSGKH